MIITHAFSNMIIFPFPETKLGYPIYLLLFILSAITIVIIFKPQGLVLGNESVPNGNEIWKNIRKINISVLLIANNSINQTLIVPVMLGVIIFDSNLSSGRINISWHGCEFRLNILVGRDNFIPDQAFVSKSLLGAPSKTINFHL